MLSENLKVVLAAALCAVACSQSGLAQPAPPSMLQVDTENIVSYTTDVFDATKFATDSNTTTLVQAPRNFGFVMAIGDVIAVNGKPAKGNLVVRQQLISLSPTPGPGQGIADIVRAAVSDYLLELQQADGTPVGNIHTLGLSAGTPAVGAPSDSGGNLVIAGGTGAFLGARGQMATRLSPGGPGPRTASITEDPAMRRNNAVGGRVQFIVKLIPMTRPEIVTGASGPAIFHSDFSPVTANKPAKAGEVLIVRAIGLGPTVPGVDPGQPFPTDTVQQVNSPVDVIINGKSADVINKIGWPGQVDAYRVDFRVPDGTAPGTASIQLTAGWIAGPSVNIPIQ